MWISRTMAIAVSGLSTACHCASPGDEQTSFTSSTSEGGPLDGSSSSSCEGTTGVPFDASRWIGRYHYETIFLPFGERGDPHGSRVLANFEVFVDSSATLFYDDCALPAPIVAQYHWEPDEQQGWLSLFPGEGEASLRLVALEDLETLRVHLVEPCRELELEADGSVVPWFSFHPGASCWVDRCTVPNLMHVDYCEGEEPPPCP